MKALSVLLLTAAVSQAYAADHGADGVADTKTQTLTSAGNLASTLSATGGNGGNGALSGGNGGAASAVLDLTAAWLASGTVSAYGGNGGAADDALTGTFGLGGDASATGVLRGAGATGSAYAQGGNYQNPYFATPTGGNASSSLTAWTTGARAVNLSSTAYAGQASAGDSNATLYVDSGVSQAAAGKASVTGNVKSVSSDGNAPGNSTAKLTLYGTGNISGTSLAQAGSVADGFLASPGAATSTVIGVTSGKHDVNLSSTAKSGNGGIFGSGGASATVSGQSASGKVTVIADANAPGASFGSSAAIAKATARTTEQGGSSSARATASGDYVNALAEAYSVGSGGSKAVAVGGGNFGEIVSTSTASDGGSRQVYAKAWGTMVEGGSFTATSEAAFGGLSTALPSLSGNAASTVVATAGGAAGLGAGMQANIGVFGYATSETAHNWEQAAAGQHLWLTFQQTASVGTFSSLDLNIGLNGASLYSLSFSSVDEANLFFSNHTLDLGVLGAGAQELSIRSDLSGLGSAYAFNYILAVPEPVEWTMMLAGLSLVMTMVRRRREGQAG